MNTVLSDECVLRLPVFELDLAAYAPFLMRQSYRYDGHRCL
jgi:hypothetical protein